MRKPVGVKCVDSVFLGYGFSPSREWYLLTPSFHPHSSRSGFVARCKSGVLVSAGTATWRPMAAPIGGTTRVRMRAP